MKKLIFALFQSFLMIGNLFNIIYGVANEKTVFIICGVAGCLMLFTYLFIVVNKQVYKY